MLYRRYCAPSAFTLVELMVSMTVLAILMVILLKVTDGTARIWQSTNSKIEEFRSARNGFETITRQLSQATLNTYWGYDNPAAPTKYLRQSELRFINGIMQTYTPVTAFVPPRPTHGVFFQAPLGFVANDTSTPNAASSYQGLENLLNTFGYYLEFASDTNYRPSFLKGLSNPPPLRYRFRLIGLMESSQNLKVYNYTQGSTTPPTPNCVTYKGTQWFTSSVTPTKFVTNISSSNRVLAENVVALIILPKLSPQDENALPSPPAVAGTALAPNYTYDTTVANSNSAIDSVNQLPPVVQVTMVAVDENSFSRLIQSGTTMPNLYANSPFTDATKYSSDLAALQNTLISNRLNFRVFSSDVVIKAAKWSRSQQN